MMQFWFLCEFSAHFYEAATFVSLCESIPTTTATNVIQCATFELNNALATVVLISSQHNP